MLCVVRGQVGRAAEAGIIEASVIKAVLIGLIGVITVARVRLLTHTQTDTDTHRRLGHRRTPTLTITSAVGLLTMDDTATEAWALLLYRWDYILSLGLIVDT